MKQRIRVLGIGPGNPEYRTVKVNKYIEEAEILVLSKRLLEEFDKHKAEKYVISGRLEPLFEKLQNISKEKTITFLLSGDVGIYALLPRVKENFVDAEISCEPGISSVQYLFSRWGKSYENVRVFSAHGRPFPYEEIKTFKGKIAILSDPKWTPNRILEEFCLLGFSDVEGIVGTKLSYKDETIKKGLLKELKNNTFEKFGVVIINEMV